MFGLPRRFLDYLYMHKEVPREQDPSLHMGFIYTAYASFIQRPEITLYSISVYLHFDCDPSPYIRCGIFHLWHHAAAQKVLGLGVFRIKDAEHEGNHQR